MWILIPVLLCGFLLFTKTTQKLFSFKHMSVLLLKDPS